MKNLSFELPAGYTFVGWSIAESGEKVYNNNDIIELYGENTNIDLYSIFSSGTYGVSYNLAGGTFGAAVSPVTQYDPSNLTYNLYEPSRIGYTFTGWAVDTNSSTGNAKINPNKTFTINCKCFFTYFFIFLHQNVNRLHHQKKRTVLLSIFL